MRKFLASCLLCLLFVNSVFSQVVIKNKDRVPNRPPGYCAWCCLEMLGRHHRVKTLENLVDKREKEFSWQWDKENNKWHKSPLVFTEHGQYRKWEHRSPGGHEAIASKLNSLKIKYYYQEYYNYDKALIAYAIRNDLACMAVLKDWDAEEEWSEPLVRAPPPSHAVVVIDYNEKGVTFIDPNDIENDYFVEHDWFNYYFVGYILIIPKQE